MATKFEDILDECLDRVLKGEDIERCLQDYPQAAGELEPLLRTALVTATSLRFAPQPEFKAQVKRHLLAKVPALKPKKRGVPLLRWSPGWALAVSLVLALLLAGGGTVVASASSLPDQPLYPVKLATERVQLAFARSAVTQARLEAKFADRRISELSQMAEKGKVGKADEAAERLAEHLERMGRIAEAQALRKKLKGREMAELRDLLARYAARHPAELQRVLPRVPPRARPIILHALRMSAQRYARAMRAIGEPLPREAGQRNWLVGKVGIVSGIIRSLTETVWVVDGRVIEVTPDTIIQGQPEVGRWARVEVEVQPDGSLKAQRVEVKARPWGPK